MTELPWNQRFFQSTRGRIVTLLRRGALTVEELAHALDLTDNAVRPHLATLERDGIVRQGGVRRGAGKPAYVYELAPDAERIFPRAYAQVLNELLDAISERLPAAEIDELLRDVGRRLAAHWRVSSLDLQQRLHLAVDALNELGGMTELEICGAGYCIRGYNCPLAALVRGHPAACCLAGALVSELVGLPVREDCECGETPRCRFIIAPALP